MEELDRREADVLLVAASADRNCPAWQSTRAAAALRAEGFRATVTTIPGVTSADVEIVWDEAWTTDRLAPRAREQLRFLPDPGRVSDPAAYREKHWTSSRPEPQEV